MINKLRVGFFFANVWTAPWRNTYKRVWSSQNIFPSNNSIEIFCCIDMEYLMRQTIFKIQRILFLKSSRLHFFGITMEYLLHGTIFYKGCGVLPIYFVHCSIYKIFEELHYAIFTKRHGALEISSLQRT